MNATAGALVDVAPPDGWVARRPCPACQAPAYRASSEVAWRCTDGHTFTMLATSLLVDAQESGEPLYCGDGGCKTEVEGKKRAARPALARRRGEAFHTCPKCSMGWWVDDGSAPAERNPVVWARVLETWGKLVSERKPITGLSPSGAETAIKCMRRYEQHYVLGLPDPPGWQAVAGSFFHKVMELWRPHPPDVRDLPLALGYAGNVWKWMLGREPAPEEADMASLIDDWKALALPPGEAPTFVATAKRSIEAGVDQDEGNDWHLVEDWVRSVLGGVPFRGKTDLLEETDLGLELNDYKGGKSPVDEHGRLNRGKLTGCVYDRDTRTFLPGTEWAEGGDEWKMLLYAAALEDQLDEQLAAVKLVYCGEHPYTVFIDTTKQGAAVARLAEVWAAVQDAEARQQYPPNPGPLCGWCPYAETCPAGSAFLQKLWRWAEREHVPFYETYVAWPQARRDGWWALATEGQELLAEIETRRQEEPF